MRPVHGKKFTGLVALAAAVGAMALPGMSMSASASTSAAPTPAEDQHHLITAAKQEFAALGPARDNQTFFVDCPKDYYALDGGFALSSVDDGGDPADVLVESSRPLTGYTGWRVTVRNGNPVRAQGNVFATCVANRTAEVDSHAHAIASPTSFAPYTAVAFGQSESKSVTTTSSCTAGIPVAPTFEWLAGSGVVRESYLKDGKFHWTFEAFDENSRVQVNLSCLATTLAGVPATATSDAYPATSLVTSTVSGVVGSLGGASFDDGTLTCPDGGTAIVGTYQSDFGFLFMGSEHRGTVRGFRFYDEADAETEAIIGATCLAAKTGIEQPAPPPFAFKVRGSATVAEGGKYISIGVACNENCTVRASIKATAPLPPIAKGRVVAYGKFKDVKAVKLTPTAQHYADVQLPVRKRAYQSKVGSSAFSAARLVIYVNGKKQVVDLKVG